MDLLDLESKCSRIQTRCRLSFRIFSSLYDWIHRKTRVMALLREIFGNGATKLKLDKRSFTTPSNRTIEINLITSNYHIEMSPGDAGFNDRYVVQEVIKEMASNKNLTSGTSKADFKVVVLSEVDRLSKQAQAALRRTMEKYASTCRLILICNSASKVMDPVRSRCLGIRIGSPSLDEVCCLTCILRFAPAFLLK
jgi:replication factor C subunit 3/5